MEIRTLNSRLVYENAWMRVREDRICHADGHEGVYGVVEKDDFALIVPVEANGDLWVVEQFRYPVTGRYVEFPQGSWEGQRDVQAEALARGELAEETGLLAGRLEHAGHLYEAYGFSNQGFDVWIASDLARGTPRRTVEEQGMQARRITRQQWRELLIAGQIKDAPSIAAYTLLSLHEDGAPPTRPGRLAG